MKEVDFKTIEALIKAELHTLNLKYILIFFLLNLAVLFVNWLVQKSVKNQDNLIYRKKLREDKKLVLIESIYKELVSFTYIFDEVEMNTTLEKVAILEKKLSENRLYLTKTMKNKITNYLDYLKKLISDFDQKDFKTEQKLLEAIENEFNK